MTLTRVCPECFALVPVKCIEKHSQWHVNLYWMHPHIGQEVVAIAEWKELCQRLERYLMVEDL